MTPCAGKYSKCQTWLKLTMQNRKISHRADGLSMDSNGSAIQRR